MCLSELKSVRWHVADLLGALMDTLLNLLNNNISLYWPSTDHYEAIDKLYSPSYPHSLKIKQLSRDSYEILCCSCALPSDGSLLRMIIWSCAVMSITARLPVCVRASLNW